LDLAERAQAYTNAAGVAVALLRGKNLLVRTCAGSAPEVGALIPASDAFIAECLNRRRPLCCRDVESDPRVGPMFRAMKTRSLIAIPICGQPEMRGVMVVIAPLPNAFQPTHTAILMTLSDIIGTKLAAREAPDMRVEIVDNPPPALTMASESAPEMKAAEMPVVAPAPIQMTPHPVETAPTPIRVEAAPVLVAQRPAPVIVAPRPATSPVAPAASSEHLETNPDAAHRKTVKLPNAPVQVAAPARPAARAPAPMVPPALLKDEPLPLVEATNVEPDPGLLNPAENPGRFEPQRALSSTTVTGPVRLVPVKIAPRPVVPVAVNTKPAPAAPLSIVAAPTLASLEALNEKSGKRRFLIPAIGVAAALVLAAVLWMYRSTSAEPAPPTIPVPAAVAVSGLPEAPVATDAQPLAKNASLTTTEPVAKPAIAEGTQPKPSKPSETQAAAAEAKHEPAKRVIEVAAAQPQPRLQAESDMSAPKLVLAAADPEGANLGKVHVAVPVPPKSELVAATLVSRTAPVYPPVAKQLGIHGTVVMSVAIGANGSVSDVRVTDGPMQLRNAAIVAVRQWRYKPATLNGQPVDSSAQVQINFTR
ncbi:MAG: TonB family protein, partial [Acidobacteriia bacterium]|nr:TonB family protein [Terriglobia bacterium]